MDEDAPPRSGLAECLSRPLLVADGAVNELHDALNARLPRLWWPLRVPSTAGRMGPPEHALYVTHAAIGLAVVARVAPRRVRAAAVTGGALLAATSWIVFTGAWDRRSRQASSAERRVR